MNALASILYRLIVKSYFWISLGAALLAILSTLYFTQQIDILLAFFCFGSTLATYNFHRWFGPGMQCKDEKFVFILLGSIIAVLALILGANLRVLPFVLLAAALSLLYIVPFGRGSSSTKITRNLRERSGFKLWIIAFTWAIATTIIPNFWILEKAEIVLIWVFLERFFFIAGITIPFDIRDVYLDQSDMKTYPQKVGEGKSKALAIILILLSISFTALIFSDDFGRISLSPIGLAYGISYGISILLILKANTHRPKWYFSLFMDGLTTVHPLLILLANYS